LRCRGTGGAEAFEGRRGFLIGALRQGDAALEAHEIGAGGVQGHAECDSVRTILTGVVGFPELGFGAEETAEQPLVADELIDLIALARGVRAELVEVFTLQLEELAPVLAVDELRIGVESGGERARGCRRCLGCGAEAPGNLFQFLVGHGEGAADATLHTRYQAGTRSFWGREG